MKKTILLSAMALCGLAMQAQFTCDPTTADVLKQNPKIVDPIILSEAAMGEFAAAGAKVNNLMVDDVDRFLYVWDGTLVGGDGSYPGVDMEESGYVSFVVGNVGWSGAGFCAVNPVDLGHFNENTRFHLGYMSPTANAPVSIGLILLDSDNNPGGAAKVALGEAFNDNGAVYPAIGPKASDDWNGIDISLADLKKLYPTFSWNNANIFKGNYFAFLGGGVSGQSFAFDACYFYNTTESGINNVYDRDNSMVVTNRTINVAAGQGVELYNAAGAKVRATNGCVLGLDGLNAGVYVARSGKEVRKVVVK